MVGHSRVMADALLGLLRQVAPDLRVAVAAGAGEGGSELGTDATAILRALEDLGDAAGVLILLDLGSALLSAQTALSLLDAPQRAPVRICPAPYVEGALAAAVAAGGGASLDDVCQAALGALESKRDALAEAPRAGSVGADDATPQYGETSAKPDDDGLHSVEALDLQSIEVTLTDPAGLHLRPAAALLRLAQQAPGAFFVSIDGGATRLPLDSLSRLLRLDRRQGQKLWLYAKQNPQATAQLEEMAKLLTPAPAAVTAAGSPRAGATPTRDASESHQDASRATPRLAVPGLAMGPVHILRRARKAQPETPQKSDPQAELRKIQGAWQKVLDATSADEILAAQSLFLQDPALTQGVQWRILVEHLSAAEAWVAAVQGLRNDLEEAIQDPALRARLSDLDDLSARVLEALGVLGDWQLPTSGACILLAEDLPPSVARRLSHDRILGVLDRRGGPQSHAAILLRAANIPYLVGIGPAPIAEGQMVAMDAGAGRYALDPTAEEQKAFAKRIVASAIATVPSQPITSLALADGSRVEFWANVASPNEAKAAASLGVAGIGLLRSEMLFLGATQAPTEVEQIERIQELLQAAGQRPVILRVLDAGADKSFPFLRLGAEPNPALGLRGIRALERRPDFFRSHLRALLRAGVGYDLRLLLPMVTIVQEVARTRQLLERLHAELSAEKIPHLWPVSLGIMVEVPAVALKIQDFVPLADFFSVGSNDLGQYTWAVDREQGDLGEIEASGRAALLDLCALVAQQKQRPVSVCGEAAADPFMARAFIARGIRRLSVAPALIPALDRALRESDIPGA
nr:putative PEP-binding protein [Acidithiobacillus caldus]